VAAYFSQAGDDMIRRVLPVLVFCGCVVGQGLSQGEGAVRPAYATFEGLEAADEIQPPDTTDPGSGLHYGRLRIVPELSLSYTHDFNPTYSAQDAEGVSSLRAQPLLDLFYLSNGWNAFARFWCTRDWYLGAGSQTYQDVVSKQHYGENLGFTLTSARGMTVTLSESFEYQNRNDVATAVTSGGQTYNASWQDRYTYILGAAVGTPLGEKTSMNAGGNFSYLFYDNPMLYDWRDIGGTLGFSRKLTEKSDALIDFGMDEQWSDGSSGISRSYRALVGVGSRPTAKSTYRAEIGAMGYSFSDGEDSAASWTYNMSGNWALTRKLSASLAGSANFQPSETDQNNYTLVQTIAGGLNYAATRRMTTSLGTIFRREEYAKEDATAHTKRLDEQISAYWRANYLVRRYTTCFVGIDVSTDSSTIDIWSYDRLFLEAGVTFRF